MTDIQVNEFKGGEYVSRINRVIDYIENNLEQSLSLSHLAAVANFSQFYFHRIFKAMMGETLNQFIQRVRVEKAATQLLAHPKKPITDIALDTGFSSSASFARVFKESFNMSASEWRLESVQSESKIRQMEGNLRNIVSNQREANDRLTCHFDPVSHQPNWRIKMTTMKDINIEVKDLPELTVAYVRNIGPYKADEELFRSLFDKLMKWVIPRGLFRPPESVFLSVYHDDPKITEEEKLRVSACITIDKDQDVDGEIGKMTIPAGRYAVASCEIAVDQYEEVWDSVMGKWLPESGYQPDDGLCYELHRNNPEEHPKHHHIVDICIPVKPL